MMYLKLAWRNIWRNRRRTFITLASVFFAVVLSSMMMSIKNGVYDKMIDSVVGGHTGYVQIHSNGYWEDRNLDMSMSVQNDLIDVLKQESGVKNFTSRVESFALVASDELTKGALVSGVDVEDGKRLYQLDERIVEGAYFDGSKGVLLGDGLADYLQVSVGDTIVLLGQGYHGASAAGMYPIQGVVKYGSPELSKQLVFLPLAEAQWLYGLEGRVTAIVIQPDYKDDAQKLAARIAGHLSSDYEVMSWEELNPDILKLMETDEAEGYVFMFILYMVVSFGIFGTVLMMMAERKHEFGVLVAIGMKRIKLALVVYYEVVIISLVGGLLGMIGAIPICAYFYYNPIRLSEDLSKMTEEYGFEPVMQASIAPDIFYKQGVVIAIIGAVIALYPFFVLLRTKAINQMRS